MIQCKTTGNEVALLGGKDGGMGEIKGTWTLLQCRKKCSCKLFFSRGLAWCVPTLYKCYTSAHILCTKKTALLLGDGIKK